ncbi:hypothetical protein H9Q74_000028 [Fusarium xylarioides]|nr:hypothetical protein H9Q71_007390 [Fusarium xylarioides]KAG5829875.1 hypothetical protein H9Q74_000028 [Fusarium xylarioides]
MLTINADEILNQQDVASGLKNWLKPKPNVKDKNTDDPLRGDDLEKCDQCIDKPKTSLDREKVSDSGKLDQKINGTVSNGKPDVKLKVEPKVQSGESNPKSNATNERKESLKWHDKRCFYN